MSNWIVVFRDAVPGVAGVTVYDKGCSDVLGRYLIAKTMKLPSGRVRWTRTYRCQRPAAVRLAEKFLRVRAAKVGREYVPGDGARTLAFASVNLGGAS